MVEVVDSGRRAGFTYVTLPGHPECGRESFVVDIGDDEAVWFTVRATSRPAAWYARIGAPVTRLAQRMITRRYLAAVAGSWRP